MQWIKQHKLIVLLLVVAVVVGAWFGLSGSEQPQPLLTTDIAENGSPIAQSADRELVGTLIELRAVTLGGTIFQDTAFRSLQDFGTAIVAEPVGRENPFAPLRATPATSTRSGR